MIHNLGLFFKIVDIVALGSDEGLGTEIIVVYCMVNCMTLSIEGLSQKIVSIILHYITPFNVVDPDITHKYETSGIVNASTGRTAVSQQL